MRVLLAWVMLAGAVSAQTWRVGGSDTHVVIRSIETSVDQLRSDVDALKHDVALLKMARPVQVEEPKPVTQAVETHEAEERTYLIAFTFPACGSCQIWKRNELPKLEAAGVAITHVNINQDQSWGVTVAPTFWIVDLKTGRVKTKYQQGQYLSSSYLSPLLTARVPKKVKTKTVTRTVQQYVAPSQGRYYQYGGRSYDLENWSPCGASWCMMCAEITGAQSRYFAGRQLINATGPQNPTPVEIIDRSLDLYSLTPSDVVAELGCGDGRVMLAIAKRFGCKVRGVELDPDKVAEARALIAESDVGHLVSVEQGDVRTFSLNGVTAVYAYLESDLLAELSPRLAGIRQIVCPGHECPGLGMVRSEDGIWWRRS